MRNAGEVNFDLEMNQMAPPQLEEAQRRPSQVSSSDLEEEEANIASIL